MTKVRKSITINADLENVIGRLATKLDQSNSQLIENVLRNDPQLNKMLAELQSAEEIPDFATPDITTPDITAPELNSKLTA